VTDPTLVAAHFGGHVEILEIDDLRARAEQVTAPEVAGRVELVRSVFDLDESVGTEDLEWAAKVSVGMDRLVDDFSLDSLAYYHRGLGGDVDERVAAGMIVGASLLTARGLPAAGEYEMRTALSMLVLDRIGAGGSFTEIQALDFEAGVVEMGHDGPAHLAISEDRPLLRGLDRYHGKRGWGVSVELAVRLGPVTTLGLGQEPDGHFRLVVSEGRTVAGPLLRIGNTTSRVDFGCGPGEWTDAWSVSGVGHHWALGTGHRRQELEAVGDLLGIEVVAVQP
jgi:L-arabinose isomerase